MNPDLALIERARAFDAQALGEIYDAYYERLYRYAYRFVSEVEAAQDIASEALRRLLEQVRAATGLQARTLAQARLHAAQGAQDALRQAEQAMTQAQQHAEQGLADPNTFRNRFRHRPGGPVEATVTPEATVTRHAPTSRPPATPHASATHSLPLTVTPQRNQNGPGQPLAGAPGPKVSVTPGQIGPGPQPTPGPSGPRSTEPPGCGSGGSCNDGGISGGGDGGRAGEGGGASGSGSGGGTH